MPSHLIHSELDSQVHRAFLLGTIANGHCPQLDVVASELGLSINDLHASLDRLVALHGLVLHPKSYEPWIIHPFSLSPTHVWVKGEKGGWWAPCLWCAFGVVTLVGGDADIRMTLGAEGEAVALCVRKFELLDPSLLVHFSVPPAKAWENVIHFCSTVLRFRTDSNIDDWCSRHRLNRGETVPATRVLELARIWYGKHLDPNWRKWTVAEATSIFAQVGLTTSFWALPKTDGTY